MPRVDRDSLLALFERHRATPSAPFEESHFLDFLVPDPKALGSIRNSFAGLRRYNAFIEDLQISFSVCLSVKDFETSYSVAALLSRVSELQRSPQGSITSLRNQQQRGFGWGTVVVGNFLAGCLLVATWRVSPAICYAVAFAAVLANLFAVRFFLRWRFYSQRLMAQLLHTAASDA